VIWSLKSQHLTFEKYHPLGSISRIPQWTDAYSENPCILRSIPGGNHVFVSFFFGPSCWVSTLWLSSSKWLARGGRRFRCVDFCALHWQCLPKTVKLSRLHCCLDICLTWSLWHVPVLLNIWWWRTNNFFESGMWRAQSKSLSFNCAGLCSAVKNGGVPGN